MLRLRSRLEGQEDLQLVPREALGVPVVRDPVHLLEGVRASGETELTVDPDERNREDEPAQGRPEPLRARSDECHPIGVDELHALASISCPGGRTIRAG